MNMESSTSPQLKKMELIQDIYIKNQSAIDEIVHHVRRGNYCTILGPRHCRKSSLLHDVKVALESLQEDHTCVFVDLKSCSGHSKSVLLAEFGLQIARFLGVDAPPGSENALKNFLCGALGGLPGDLVLLIDHLERIPIGPVTSLLRTLRAVFTEQTSQDPKRVVVVVASSLSVADLSLEATSPFNIAHPILIRDLAPEESDRLIDALCKDALPVSRLARDYLKEITQGDCYLIPYLYQRCIRLRSRSADMTALDKEDVETAEKWFMQDQAPSYSPFRETIRTLEDEPTNLLNTLKVLKRGSVPGRELDIELHSGINRLQLTGAVRWYSGTAGTTYQIRNDLYRRRLQEHFHPERVVQILRLSGRLKEAVDYMVDQPASSLRGQLRPMFLALVVDLTYTSGAFAGGVDQLATRISQAFDVAEVAIYTANFSHSHLELISYFPAKSECAHQKSIPLKRKDKPVHVYFGPRYEIDHGSLWVRLRSQDKKSFGVAIIKGFDADAHGDEFLTLLAFLKQVGWALARVHDQQRERLQLSTLTKTGEQLARSLDLDRVASETVAAGINAVPGAQRGVLFLWNSKTQELKVAAQQGYRSTLADEISLKDAEGYVGQVFRSGQGLRISDARRSPLVTLKDDPDVRKQKSVACVPLVVWGRPIGVFCVDNTSSNAIFTKEDESLLATFASHAAVAIQNARVSKELYELGMRINRGDMTPKEIFQHAVESITLVGGAYGANMLLLRDTHDPDLCLRQKPTLSVSFGLGEEYVKKIRPRPRGMTYCALKSRNPVSVSHPEEEPGINDLPKGMGIKASLCIPMIVQKKILGVLFVRHNKIHSFSRTETEMLTLFVNMCAMAIESSRRREQLKISASVAWMGIEMSDMGHGITQKVSAIHNTLFSLRSMIGDNLEALSKVEEIEQYADKIAAIPRRTLTPFEDRIQHVSLNEALREEVDRWLAAHQAIDRKMNLTEEDTSVNIDRQRFAIVPKVLVTNAVRAMKRAREPYLSITTTIRDGCVVADFANNGQAIPIDIQQRLFHAPIQKSEGAKGAGVGLLIARTVMLGCGGDLELLDSNDEETTFRLWLQLAR